MMDLRCVAYAVGGDRIGVLPDALQFTVTVPRNDTPTISLTYPERGGVRGNLLDGEIEIAVEATFNDGVDWQEVPGCRFISQEASRDLASDGTTSRSLQAVHISAVLGEALVWDVPKDHQDKEGKFKFKRTTAGTMVRTLWDRAVRRGWGRGLTAGFTPEKDSAPAAWDTTAALAFAADVSLDQVLETVTNLGMCDVAWEGRTMRLYNADTVLARDRTGAVKWLLTPTITGAPETTRWADMCTDVIVRGETGRTWRIHNDAAPTTMRRIEKVVEGGGIELEDTAKLVAQASLKSGSRPAEQIKREWHSDVATYLPWRDYRPGDWILLDRGGDSPEKVQVTQISMTRDDNGVSGHTTFGTQLASALTRIAKRQRGVIGGAAVSGSTVRPSTQAQTRRPDKVQSLGLHSQALINSYGRPVALVSASWDPVTSDDVGADLDVDSYDLAYRRSNVSGFAVTTVRVAPGQVVPLEAGRDYVFKVRAVADGTAGAWSDEAAITTAVDIEPPPTPSKPALGQTLGVLNISWDGLGSRAEAMPADYDHVEVSIQIPGAPPARTTDMVKPVQQIPVADLAMREWEVRLRAVDTSDNKSDWSAPASITLEQLVDADAIGKAVDEKIKNSQAVLEAARAEALKSMEQLTGAMTQVAVSLVETGPYPPDAGIVDKTQWVSPDARVFVLRKKGD